MDTLCFYVFQDWDDRFLGRDGFTRTRLLSEALQDADPIRLDGALSDTFRDIFRLVKVTATLEPQE